MKELVDGPLWIKVIEELRPYTRDRQRKLDSVIERIYMFFFCKGNSVIPGMCIDNCKAKYHTPGFPSFLQCSKAL